MPQPNLQDRIFDLILQKYARRVDAVTDLCQVLNTTKDPVYRRLRGDTPLAPQEIVALAHHYQLSLDALAFDQSDNVVCSFNAFSQKINDFTEYLESYVADLDVLRRLPEAHFYYASAEIPVMTYNFIPELISFKLYVWGRTTWNFDFLRDRPFGFDLVTPPVIRLSRAVLEHYIHIDSTELWSLNIVDNTLAQIEYHAYSSGFREPTDAMILCDKLLEWAAHMKAMAAAGRKFAMGSKPSDHAAVLNLYQNEIVYTNNTALIVSKLGKAVYSAFANPNFLKSADPKLCQYAENWFATVISKSNPISQTNEKQRDWFFQGLNKKIERVKQRIQVYIDENQ